MNDPTRPLRRAFRAWRNQQRLVREARYYHNEFRRRGLKIPSPADIQNQITGRFPGQTPRRKGSLRILAIYHDYNWEGPAFGTSLAAFGEVRHVDWMGLTAEKLVQAVSASAPLDVAFTYLSGEQMTPASMEALRTATRAPLVNLALNDKETFVGKIRRGQAMGARDICRWFDLCWTSTEDALEKYVVEGAIPIYLPEGGNPDVHRPYAEELRYDVSFVGQCYGNRPEVIARLQDAGVKVVAFGPGWPNGPLPTEEMIRTWSRSRINLGFGGVLGHKDTFCLKARDFEVPLSGRPYLTEHHAELRSFFEIGQEIVTYTGFDDLLAKIRHLLAHPEEAVAIGQAGRTRVLREHTWEMRFARVFELVGALAKEE
jgi:spore maturation protein CgeB